HHGGPAEQIAGGALRQRVIRHVQPGGADHAVHHHQRPAAPVVPDHHVAAAADAAHPGLQRADREGRRHRRIDRIAAGAQHPGADVGRLLVLRGDDAVSGPQGLLAEGQGAAEILRHGTMPPKHIRCAALAGMLHSGKAICGRDRANDKDSLDRNRLTMVSFVSLHTNSRGELNMQSRRFRTLVSVLAIGVGLGLAADVAAQDKKTLRMVPHAGLRVTDPIITTAFMSRNHGYMIYDTLFAVNDKMEVKPQMVDKYDISGDKLTYTFTLRDGLKFH